MRRSLVAVLAVFMVCAVSARAADLVVASDLRQESDGTRTRLSLVVPGSPAFTHFNADPLTLVVDLAGVDVSRLPRRLEVGTREVDSVKIASLSRADGNTLARIEVRLAQAGHVSLEPTASGVDILVSPSVERGVSSSAAVAPVEAPVVASPAPVVGRVSGSTILSVSPLTDGTSGYQVLSDGPLQPEAFALKSPNRIVVDFSGVSSKQTSVSGSGAAQRARLAQFSTAPRVARLVLDLARTTPFHVETTEDGARIVLDAETSVALSSSVVAAAPRYEPAPMQRDSLAALPAAMTVERLAPEPVPVSATIPVAVAAAPAPSLASATTSSSQTPETSANAPDASDQGASTAPACGEPPFSGHAVSFDFKEGDIIDLFRLMSEISGLNMVVNPGVSGRVSLALKDVPWDQALSLILKTQGLGCAFDGNVVRIAKLIDLQKEEQDKRNLQKAKEDSGPLTTWRHRLSYLDPTSLKSVIEKTILSSRGTMTPVAGSVFLVTDIPERVEAAQRLIADLDRPVAQVEIEARIVVTSRNFTRQLGVQWGFLNQQTPQFGNTTDLSFPNSLILNGQGVPGGGLPADQGGLAPTAGIGSANRGYMVNLPAAGFNTAIGISTGNILGSFNLDAALTALEVAGRARIISTPRITTQDKVAAEIKQGVQIPYQTISNNTVTVAFKDAGLVMKVTPQVTDAGTVFLQVNVENSSPDFGRIIGSGAAAVPPINTQSAQTSVLVRDGSTTVIGGIYQGQETNSRQNTPLLAQIPILGNLFKNRSLQTLNNELLIFITPRIVR